MMLHALNGYYERMLNDPEADMPSYGTSIENVSFALVLGEDGSLRAIEDLRIEYGSTKRPRKIPVPAAVTRTSGIKANFLWDKAAYVFGADGEGATAKNRERFEAFNDLLLSVGKDVEDSGFAAVRNFLQQWDCAQSEAVVTGLGESWEDMAGANLAFRLDGVPGFIHERQAVQRAWLNYNQDSSDAPLGQCLITGEQEVPLARIHTPIKGVRGGQTSGGYIVSFNASAFVSYQQDKASVAETSAFAYTTALNALLSGDSRQKIAIGDATYAFWAKRPTPAEGFLADLFDPPAEETGESGEQDDRVSAGKIHGLLKMIRDGRKPTDILPELDEEVQFYILGLAPNAARLSIRFWQETSLGDLLEKVGRHYREIDIVRQFDSEPEFPSLWRLLVQTATLGKSENISPVLAGGLTRAMLTGGPYPQNLLPVVLDRIRSEHNVTYFRAALLKAYLLRNKQMEVPVALDLNRTDQPYLLGRLFAVLEKAQEEAIPGANATVKDRYFGAVAATPQLVLPLLLRNAANHIAKLRKDSDKRGRAIYFDRMIQDINCDLAGYPKTQTPEQQGLFMIGYYHQRKNFFTSQNQEG